MRDRRSENQSVLEQYAAVFDAVEINSSFYRPHRRSTYERWRDSVPAEFRFSVKLPRAITHELRLVESQEPLVEFMQGASGLGRQLAVILVQLPPSHVFDEAVATAFFELLRAETGAHIACEARNPSWFENEATAVLEGYGVTRVLADPVPPGCKPAVQNPSQLVYRRLHGAPRMYYSGYSIDYLHGLASTARAAAETWCIFDNTAAGAAWSDAATLRGLLGVSARSIGGTD